MLDFAPNAIKPTTSALMRADASEKYLGFRGFGI